MSTKTAVCCSRVCGSDATFVDSAVPSVLRRLKLEEIAPEISCNSTTPPSTLSAECGVSFGCARRRESRCRCTVTELNHWDGLAGLISPSSVINSASIRCCKLRLTRAVTCSCCTDRSASTSFREDSACACRSAAALPRSPARPHKLHSETARKRHTSGWHAQLGTRGSRFRCLTASSQARQTSCYTRYRSSRLCPTGQPGLCLQPPNRPCFLGQPDLPRLASTLQHQHCRLRLQQDRKKLLPDPCRGYPAPPNFGRALID